MYPILVSLISLSSIPAHCLFGHSSSDFLEVQSRSYVLQTLSSHSRPVALMASEARYTSKGTTVGTGGMLESMLSFPLA